MYGPLYHFLTYYHFADPYRDWHFKTPIFYELYNMTDDVEQMHNVYSSSPSELKQTLAQQLREQYACKGATCA